MNGLKLALALCYEVTKAIRQAAKNEQIKEIERDPNAWISDHFGRVRDDETKASKTKD